MNDSLLWHRNITITFYRTPPSHQQHVWDDNHKPCSVCYSDEGQLAVGYQSGGKHADDDNHDDEHADHYADDSYGDQNDCLLGYVESAFYDCIDKIVVLY